MPLVPIDFSKTTIYIIRCNDEAITDCYIGSTTNFTNRKSSHKKACTQQGNTNYNYKVYDFIRKNGGFDNWSIIPLENFSCENSIQKQIREQHWMDLFRPTLNVMNAYCKNEKARQYRKKYNDEHKEQRFEKHDCGCGGKYVNSQKCVHIKTQRHRDWEAAQQAAQTDFVI